METLNYPKTSKILTEICFDAFNDTIGEFIDDLEPEEIMDCFRGAICHNIDYHTGETGKFMELLSYVVPELEEESEEQNDVY